jgi:DNA-binding NtrC family response regulator
MQLFPVPAVTPRMHPRTALVASADRSFRQRITHVLAGLRWQVREAEGGAQAWTEAEAALPDAFIVDSWLPDLDIGEFLGEFRGRFPEVDLVTAAGNVAAESPRGPYRQELLYALRLCQETDTAAWNTAPAIEESQRDPARLEFVKPIVQSTTPSSPIPSNPALTSPVLSNIAPLLPFPPAAIGRTISTQPGRAAQAQVQSHSVDPNMSERLPGLVGNAACMLEVSRRVRLVAARMTPVLIEGPTGSGKELVAEALHRLSTRSRKPFVTINCAAIPEALLEAELFGHTRGAFTGAVRGRTGRIEAADGGTLFLDEIGEMPLALQAKLLRFVECGELQRVGDNEIVKVDVRILAATHQPLAPQAQNGAFRSDLYYRLAVFLIRTPSLAEHTQDLLPLIDHFLQKLGRDTPVKRLDESAFAKLGAHNWPGNVRELEHVLERGIILAGDNPVLTASEIDFGLAAN